MSSKATANKVQVVMGVALVVVSLVLIGLSSSANAPRLFLAVMIFGGVMASVAGLRLRSRRASERPIPPPEDDGAP